MITAKGRQLDWHEGMTIGEVLEVLGYTFPLVLVRVNGELVKKSRWTEFSVPDGASIDVQPVVAGG
jgi:thiamine biosynthesis protein ThiS